MARKQTIDSPIPANLSNAEIRAAIPKLKRRIQELESFDPAQAASGDEDGTIQALKIKINDTLEGIYGHNSTQYETYKIFSMSDTMRISMGFGGGPSHHEYIDAYQKGKQKALAKLNTALSILEEAIEDAEGSPSSSAPFTLAGCDLHPAINAACAERYKNGHYADAIEAACKALNALVQAKSGNYDLADTELMQKVFSANSPVLAFNEMKDKHDEGEQQGMMFLYKGVYLAFRNQRAHKLIDDTPEDAFSVINAIDFLAKMLDKASLRM